MKFKNSVLEVKCVFFLFLFYLVFKRLFISHLVKARNKFKWISHRFDLLCKRYLRIVYAACIWLYL